MKPSYVKQCMDAPTNGGQLQHAILKFSNSLAAGRLPEQARPFFGGAKLTALWKSGLRTKVRPIANGVFWRKLVGTLVVRRVARKARGILMPRFVGIGVSAATEAAGHSLRAIVRAKNHLQGRVLLKLDLANAFNSNKRSVTRAAIERLIPELLPWFDTCYSKYSRLYYRDDKDKVGFIWSKMDSSRDRRREACSSTSLCIITRR